jgi:hypothetical protein
VISAYLTKEDGNFSTYHRSAAQRGGGGKNKKYT